MLASIIDYFEKDFVTVDWDGRALRIVHAAIDRRGVEILAMHTVHVPGGLDLGSPESIGQFVRRVLKDKKIDVHRMTVDVPRDQVSFKTLKVPKASANELPRVVEFQVAKELPFAVSEAVIDFTVVDDESGVATCDVVVAAVRNEVLDFYRKVAEHAGLKLERVGLRPSANAVAVSELLRRTSPERVLFVDVGPTLTEIDIIRRGRLVFSRSGSVHVPEGAGSTPASGRVGENEGGPSLRFPGVAGESETATAIRSLLVEVTRSIENYRTIDPNVKIDHIVVGGGCGIEDELAEALQSRLNATAETFNPAAVFGWDADRGAAACAFAATLGLALGHKTEGRLQLDFIHPKRTVTSSRLRLQRAPVQGIAAALLIGASIVAYVNFVLPQHRQLAGIKEVVSRGDKLLKDQEKLAALVRDAEAFDGGQVVWIDAMRDLVEAIPSNKDAIVTRMNMDEADRRIKVSLAGKQRAVGDQAVASLDSYKVDEKRLFEANATQTREAAGHSYPFESQLIVRVLGKEKPVQNTRARR